MYTTIQIFFRWTICHENDNKNGLNVKSMESTFFSIDHPPPLKGYVLYTLFNIDSYPKCIII